MDVSHLLDSLNEKQRKAVSAPCQNIMVLAGAGSGKTRVLAHRIAWYVKTGECAPSGILAVTFTNKAAAEMRSRIEQLLAIPISGMWVGTFHGLNHRILRMHWQEAGLLEDFTILDSEDQLRTIRRVLRGMKVDEKDFVPREVQWFINARKDEGLRPKHIADNDDPRLYQMIRIYKEYEDLCNRSGVVDFAELLLRVHELLLDHTHILENFCERFKFILVDEFQDTNTLQYAWLRLLNGEHGCLFAVGDDDQCLEHSTQVTMGDGTHKQISDIKIGDQVLSNFGAGDFRPQSVTDCFKQSRQGTMINIHLDSGRIISSTPEHTHFAGYCEGETSQNYCSCLLYRQGSGYWLATSQIYADHSDHSQLAFARYAKQESADALWILNTYQHPDLAHANANIMAQHYGLPTSSQGSAQNPYAGEQLLESIGGSLDDAHYLAQGKQAGKCTCHIILCSDNQATTPLHTLSVIASSQHDQKLLSALGFTADQIKRTSQHWEFVAQHNNFSTLMQQVRMIRQSIDSNILLWIKIFKQSLPFIRTINIRPGMLMANVDGNFDIVRRIEYQQSATVVCDINVDSTHNFIANGVVTHNSIYSWRGACVENMQKFNKDFANPLLIKLEQNYRSTQNILGLANHLIAHNNSRQGKELWTEEESGEKIALYNGYNEHDEARYIVAQMANWKGKTGNYKDSAVFYRVSAQSRVIEEQLMQANIPYRVYGGMRFYERAEIKNVLSYVRLATFHDDDISFERIVNTPTRGIGQRTLEELRATAREEKTSLWQAAGKVLQTETLTARACNALEQFMHLITAMGESTTLPIEELIGAVIQSSGLIEHYQKEKGERGFARIENIQELINAASEFNPQDEILQDMEPLQAFLAHAALEAGDKQAEAYTDSVSLMTLHAAKGLEFANVYLVGLEEGLFPHQRSSNDLAQLEEERRLCYVGITRAKKALTISYTQHRRLNGKEYYPRVSRFINELPKELINQVRMGGSIIEPMFVQTTIDDARTENSSDSYKLGQHVHHPKFGDGVIMLIEGNGKHTKLQVNFRHAGSKWLIASHAKLTTP